MKKFIVVLLFCISALTFFILHNDYKETYTFQMKNIENHLSNSTRGIIPTGLNSLPRQSQYDKLIETSNKNEVNMYFSRIDQDGEKEKIIKYIYTTDNEYMDKIKLIKGEKLNSKNIYTNSFLSTKDTGDPNQIGQIASFDGVEMEIHTLRTMLDEGFMLDGSCVLSAKKSSDIKEYVDMFKDQTAGIGKMIEVSKAIDIGETPEVKYYQIYGLFIIFALTILYYILGSYKKIAIEKMLGYSLIDIWKKRICLIFIVQVITIIVSSTIMSLILFKDINILQLDFLKSLIIKYIYLILITLLVASIPFIYINNIHITSLIKNKQQVKDLLIINNTIKVLVCISFIFLISQQFDNYDEIKKAFDGSYKRWTSVQNYKVLSLNRITEENFFSEEFLNTSVDIYKDFNRNGSIFADFSSYTELSKELNKNAPLGSRFALINPNYMKENPVYDINGKAISISEDNKNWVLLLPEIYKKDETTIRDYYNNTWIPSYGPSYKAKLEIIWTKPNQKFFSYNFAVNPSEGSYVTDPIFFVGTEAGGFRQWNSQVFNVEGNPFKVKVLDEENYKDEIMSVLNKYGFDSYGVQINYANEQVASASKDYKDMFKWIVTGILFCIVIITVIVVQNINNFFEQYKTRWALRQLHGYGIFQKYIEYFITVIGSWIVITIGSLVVIRTNYKVILVSAFIGLVIEVVFSLIALNVNQNKKIVKFIKGGV